MSVGLDIGTKSIKVVELGQEGGKPVLRAAGAVGHSGLKIDELREDSEIANLASTIKKLFKDAKISSKEVAIALPESQVYTRIMKFPLLNDQEIASAVKWQAEEFIPIPVKEAIIEHQILESQETGNPPRVLVLLIAAQRSLVEKYVKICNSAGLNVSGVETELMSLVRSLAPVDKTAVILDFGAHSTDIAISVEEQLFFSRSIPTAGDAFTRAVSQSLGVSVQQAEQYKRVYGLVSGQLEDKVSSSLQPIIKVVTEEVKKALHFFQLETRKEKPSTIILSGGSAGIPGAVPALTKMIGTEVVIGDPFTKVSVDPESRRNLESYIPLYGVAMGLALRND